WDAARESLLLAVDRFGIKRLYYASDERRVAFAGKPSALLAAPGVDRAVDPTAIYSYLNFGYLPGAESAFAGIRRLEPGHFLVVTPRRGEPRRYWDLSYAEEAMSEADAAEQMYRLTEAAVREALGGARSKETGAFLSGGTDSSTIVGLLARRTGERVNAFSIGFAEERYNELRYAELAARHFGAAHYTRTVTAEDALATMPRLVEAYDEPFGNNSAIGTLFCAELARECGVTRLLAGDGGDEIFGGNAHYATDAVFARYQRVPRLIRRGALEPLLHRLPDSAPSVLGRAKRYVSRANLPAARRFYSYGFFFAQNAATFLDPDFVASVDLDAPWRLVQQHFDTVEASSELNRRLYIDLKLAIGANDLLKVTRTAELAGLAVRFPLLDPALVGFTTGLPAHFKVRGLEKRYLFKRAFKDLLPRDVLAKRKHGFGVPTSSWLKNHAGFQAFARDTLRSARAASRGYFRPDAVDELFRRHAVDTTPYYGDVLWTVLMLELWHRRHVDVAKTA
ncbi:MAG: asparagine synthetase B family protein, partial [Candidatus Rokuibacteriota bacterium]